MPQPPPEASWGELPARRRRGAVMWLVGTLVLLAGFITQLWNRPAGLVLVAVSIGIHVVRLAFFRMGP